MRENRMHNSIEGLDPKWGGITGYARQAATPLMCAGTYRAAPQRRRASSIPDST
jgi:hypothetical protein